MMRNETNLLFCTNTYAILLNLASLRTQILENYREVILFESIYSLDENHFAIVDRYEGVLVYKIGYK